MQTEALKERLDTAILELLSVFNVSDAEHVKFQPFSIRRDIPDEYRGRLLERVPVPSYHYLKNFFYFPIEDVLDHFSDATTTHEAGHYVHTQINDMVREGALLFEEKGESPPQHSALCELVAELGVYASGKKREALNLSRLGKQAQRVYNERGSSFIPLLARMKLEEAKALSLLDF